MARSLAFRPRALVWIGLLGLGVAVAPFAFINLDASQAQSAQVLFVYDGKLAVVSPSVLMTVPSDYDLNIIAQRRTALTERGEVLDPRPGRNLVRDLLHPEPIVFALRSGDVTLTPLPSETLVLDYLDEYAGNGLLQQHVMVRVFDFGGKPHLVAEPGTATPPLLPSPDGSRYVFEASGSLWVVEPVSRHVRQITSNATSGFNRRALLDAALQSDALLYWATDPAWSPDGRYIAYFTNRSNLESTSWGEIWIADVVTGAEFPVVQAPEPVRALSWPQNDRLLVARYSVGNPTYTLWLVGLDGSVHGQLLSSVADPNVVSIAHQSEFLVYSTSRPHKDLYALRPQLGEQRPQLLAALTDNTYFDPDVRISPAGTKAVVLQRVGSDGESIVRVFALHNSKQWQYRSPDANLISGTPEWVDDN